MNISTGSIADISTGFESSYIRIVVRGDRGDSVLHIDAHPYPAYIVEWKYAGNALGVPSTHREIIVLPEERTQDWLDNVIYFKASQSFVLVGISAIGSVELDKP